MDNEPQISPEAEQDYDALLGRLIPMAEEWLEKQGGFLPCGAAVTVEGEPIGVMVDPGDSPTTEGMMEQLFAVLRARAEQEEIRASCACFDGYLAEEDGEELPSIVVILEHIDGPATILHRPYKQDDNGEYLFADLIGHRVHPNVFVAD